MRPMTVVTAAFFLALVAGSTAALAAEPDGNWTCRTSTGAPGGTLLLGEASYAYSSATDAAATFGRSRIDGNFVTILDGPLARMGAKSGYYAVGPYLPAYFLAGTPEARSQLNFGIGPGKGLLCTPDRAPLAP